MRDLAVQQLHRDRVAEGQFDPGRVAEHVTDLRDHRGDAADSGGAQQPVTLLFVKRDGLRVPLVPAGEMAFPHSRHSSAEGRGYHVGARLRALEGGHASRGEASSRIWRVRGQERHDRAAARRENPTACILPRTLPASGPAPLAAMLPKIQAGRTLWRMA